MAMWNEQLLTGIYRKISLSAGKFNPTPKEHLKVQKLPKLSVLPTFINIREILDFIKIGPTASPPFASIWKGKLYLLQKNDHF